MHDSLYLILVSNDGRASRQFRLESGENLIGRWDPERGAFPEIDLEDDDSDARVSRKHAVIHVRESDCILEDIGSLNGTFINGGPRLEAGVPYKVQVGDILQLGRIKLKLCSEPDLAE